MTDGPLSPGVLAKSLHDTLDAALTAIPAGHNHAILFDATASTSASPTVRGLFVQRAPDGWNIVLEGDVDTAHGISGSVALAKSW